MSQIGDNRANDCLVQPFRLDLEAGELFLRNVL
ncbi:hypothetical protein X755_31110 [Mesorhizobium sp. LNJC405B00]|nr:hypothetical protein X761_31745 [Mesorhizobium sp. LSHC424B00]ESX64261.1 hypothetical protein X758_31980 [Mesorhizobium sp. LSHC416B00]ESX85163.1 hypothetical protein X755_31110 [Mesorhizobium sp. LNJC405B00]